MYGGIPQGSALPSTITLVCCGKDLLTVATSMNQQLLCNVQKWLVDNRVQLNLKKSCVI